MVWPQIVYTGNQENNNVAVFAQKEYYCAIPLKKSHFSSFEFVLKINECRCWKKAEISNCIIFNRTIEIYLVTLVSYCSIYLNWNELYLILHVYTNDNFCFLSPSIICEMWLCSSIVVVDGIKRQLFTQSIKYFSSATMFFSFLGYLLNKEYVQILKRFLLLTTMFS